MAVIRTRNAPTNRQYTVTGTQMQIASAINKIGGGIGFKSGARVTQFETGGYLGQTLQPPVYTPSSTTIVNNSPDLTDKFDQLIAVMEKNNIEQSKRIDRIEVLQVTGTVTAAQRKIAQQSKIATL